MINPNIEELEIIKSQTKIEGIKLILTCGECKRKWSIWFSGLNDLINNLPEDWHICMTCKNKKFSDKELQKDERIIGKVSK